MMGPSPNCYTRSLVAIGPLVPEKNILKGVYHIWVWRPSLSGGPDAANKLSFPIHLKAPHKFGFD